MRNKHVIKWQKRRRMFLTKQFTTSFLNEIDDETTEEIW